MPCPESLVSKSHGLLYGWNIGNPGFQYTEHIENTPHRLNQNNYDNNMLGHLHLGRFTSLWNWLLFNALIDHLCEGQIISIGLQIISFNSRVQTAILRTQWTFGGQWEKSQHGTEQRKFLLGWSLRPPYLFWIRNTSFNECAPKMIILKLHSS